MNHQYGNASQQANAWVLKNSFLDRHFQDSTTDTIPGVSSEQTISELNSVAKLISEMDADAEKRYKSYDRGLQTYLLSFSFQDENMKHLYESLINNVIDDVMPLIYKVKLHYQRPRPFQLAAINSIKLFPYASLSAHCPAYPSMHSCIIYVLNAVVGNRFVTSIPEVYRYYNDLATDVANSRMRLGLCLESDLHAGVSLANRVLADREFLLKYKL